MENYFIDDYNTPQHLKISDDNKISLYSYINIYQKDDIYKKKIRKTIMENLKIKHYLKIGETCSICLDEILRRKDAFLTDCGHSFHIGCIINYDYKNSFVKLGVFCPLCRSDMGNYLDFRDRYKYSRNCLDILEDFENNKHLKLPQICYNYYESYYNHHFYGNRYKDCYYCRLKR